MSHKGYTARVEYDERAKLLAGAKSKTGDYAGANAEDPDEYKAENVFWVPADARWSHLQASAKQPTIGKTVDDAMVAIERDNPRLKGVLPKDYARQQTLFIDARKLGTLIDRVHRELTDVDLEKITSTYHAWRGNAVSRGGAENAEEKTMKELDDITGAIVDAALKVHIELGPGLLESVYEVVLAGALEWFGELGCVVGADEAVK